MPNLFVMAGPNGAGKTTTSRLILTGPRSVAEFVNADIIAAEQGLDDIAAGRRMLERLDELTAQRQDVAFETTLSSAAMRNRISAMQDAGYVFHLIYVWLPNPEMSIQRVAARVRAGGHHIPEDVIRRRYPRSLQNLFNVFIPQADAWLMIDNSHLSGPMRIAECDVGAEIHLCASEAWGAFTGAYLKGPVAARPPRDLVASEVKMEETYLAARRAVDEALRRHKARGESVVVWRDGKIVTLKPEEIDV